MKIQALYLENIGVFNSLKIAFPEKKDTGKAEIHILTGQNGTGKSTILYALATAFGKYDLIEKRMRISKEEKSFVNIILSDESQVGLVPRDYEGNPFYINKVYLKPTVYKPIILENLQYTFDSEFFLGYYQKTQSYTQNKNKTIVFNSIALSYSGNRSVESYKIVSIQEKYQNPFFTALSFNNSVQNDMLFQWIANNKSKQAIALMEGHKEKANKYRVAIEKIEELVSEITGWNISFIFETEPLEITLKVNDDLLDIDVLPEGLKSILSWIADLLMKMDQIRWIDDRDIFEREFILFLDEIEVHLHPEWQRKILPVVQKYFKNAQIFIATHSPFVVGSVEGAYVHSFGYENNKVKYIGVEDSRAGSSVNLILDKIFSIDSEFDVKTEKELNQFRTFRDTILANKYFKENEWLLLVKKLKNKSYELKDIIQFELMQIKKRTGKDYLNV